MRVRSGQSSAMSSVRPACAILSTKCVTKLVACRTEHSTRKVWVRYRRSNSKGEWDSSTLRRWLKWKRPFELGLGSKSPLMVSFPVPQNLDKYDPTACCLATCKSTVDYLHHSFGIRNAGYVG